MLGPGLNKLTQSIQSCSSIKDTADPVCPVWLISAQLQRYRNSDDWKVTQRHVTCAISLGWKSSCGYAVLKNTNKGVSSNAVFTFLVLNETAQPINLHCCKSSGAINDSASPSPRSVWSARRRHQLHAALCRPSLQTGNANKCQHAAYCIDCNHYNKTAPWADKWIWIGVEMCRDDLTRCWIFTSAGCTGGFIQRDCCFCWCIGACFCIHLSFYSGGKKFLDTLHILSLEIC